MTDSARSLWVVLIATILAGMFAVLTPPLRSEASVPMPTMAMTAGGQDCAKCNPKLDKMAGCDLTCALSTVGVLPGHVAPASVLVGCHFDMSDATAAGLTPSPALTPPRAIILA